MRIKLTIIAILLAFCYVTGVYGQSADMTITKTGTTHINVGDSVSYVIKIANNGPNVVNGATFNDIFPVSWFTGMHLVSCTSTGGTTCPLPANYSISNASFSGTLPNMAVGSSITFTLKARSVIPAPATSFSNTATVALPGGFTDPDMSTNSATWNTTVNGASDIVVTKSQSNGNASCAALSQTTHYVVTWKNNGSAWVTGIRLRDEMDIGGYYTGIGAASFTFPWAVTNQTWTVTNGSGAGQAVLTTQNNLPASGSKTPLLTGTPFGGHLEGCL